MVTTSPDGKSLVKNCSGLLVIEYESPEGSGEETEKRSEHQALRAEYLEAKESCKAVVAPNEFYADLWSLGLEYGPAFANLCDIRNRDQQSMGAVKIPDVLSKGSEGYDRPHIIHPGTLDAVFHLAFAAVMGGDERPPTAMVPKSIDEVVISNAVPFLPGTRIPGYSNAGKHGLKELKADIVVLDDRESAPVIEIAGFLCAEIASTSSSDTSKNSAKSISSKLTWRPAIDLLSAGELSEALGKPEGVAKLSEYFFTQVPAP